MSAEPDVFVLDGSAALWLYCLDGPLPPRPEPGVARGARGDAWLLAPDLLWVECSSVLLKQVKRNGLASEEVVALLQEISDLPIRILPSGDLCKSAFSLATGGGISAYDALYLARFLLSLPKKNHRLLPIDSVPLQSQRFAAPPTDAVGIL